MRHEIFIMCDADRVRVARAAQVVSVGTLVTLQFKRSIDKRIDVPTLHVDSTGIAHGGLDTESNAMRKIVNCVSGLGFAVREGLLARLALRLTNFL